jgi:hypothetical protein
MCPGPPAKGWVKTKDHIHGVWIWSNVTGLSLIFLSGQSSRRTSRSSRWKARVGSLLSPKWPAGCALAISHVAIGYTSMSVWLQENIEKNDTKWATYFKPFPLISCQILGLWLIRNLAQITPWVWHSHWPLQDPMLGKTLQWNYLVCGWFKVDTSAFGGDCAFHAHEKLSFLYKDFTLVGFVQKHLAYLIVITRMWKFIYRLAD